MVKVRTSQIPESSGKPQFTKGKMKKTDDDWLDDDIDNNNYNHTDDDGEKEERYIKSMINFPEEGINI